MPDGRLIPGEGDIVLTPHATLRFEGEDSRPWQESLLALGAVGTPLPPVPAFWARMAADCVRELCRAADPETPSPSEADALASLPLPDGMPDWPDSAPPMPGGEYLSSASLALLWSKLAAHCAAGVRKAGGIAPFLEGNVPGWLDVGRVFLHLAENRLDQKRPFVFLATYTTGLGPNGRPRHAPLSQALARYGKARDFPVLKRILTPVEKAADRLPWVRRMLESQALFSPRAWLPEQAYEFLKSVPELEACGMGVRLPDWWKKRAHPTVRATISTRGGKSPVGGKSLISFDVAVALGDETLDEEEVRRLCEAAEKGLALYRGKWIEVDAERLRQVLEHWERVRDDAEAGLMTFHDGLRLLGGMPAGSAGFEDAGDEWGEWSRIEPGAGFRELLRAARADADLEETPIPGLRATLRPYQTKGVAWMRLLGRLGMGACLADDMGLGKTVQVLALLLEAREREKGLPPTLLVAPASLLSNWKAEAERFAPDLRVLVLHPSETPPPAELDQALLEGVDLAVTSYSLAARLPWIQAVVWRRVVVDEAQAIKNPGTRQSRTVRALSTPARIALTGTPVENGLTDLWTIFDFLNPGLLGTLADFAKATGSASDKGRWLPAVRRVASPYILRRLKTDEAIRASLPDKIETTLHCSLTREQATLYGRITERLKKELERERDRNAPPRTMLVLSALTLLKQICNHPSQAGLLDEAAYAPEKSGKFIRVGELCSEISSRQERVLVFTQYREIIDPLVEFLTGVFGRPGLSLHGGTPVKRRRELVKDFQREDGPPFFVISLKAGGTGLTLTAASHVVLFDRWWNPAVEDQAADRAFRIGQTKNVQVHRCVTRGTLEERIDALVASKRALAGEILAGDGGPGVAAMSDEEIMDLVRLDLRRAAMD